LKQFQSKKNGTNGSTGLHGNDDLLLASVSGRSTPSSVTSIYSATSKASYLPQSTHAQVASPSNDSTLREQLQLHVQTIGILVAEKAELQSKLQQLQKKADKKEEECDELTGRLKTSRQKIADLERQLQQFSSSQSHGDTSDHSYPNVQFELQRLNNEMNSKDMLINELKVLLAESNEKLSLKQSEMQKLSQVTLDLKSHLEIAKMRESSGMNYEEEIFKLREINSDLESRLEKQKSDLNEDYQSLVERLVLPDFKFYLKSILKNVIFFEGIKSKLRV
jgi:chromosome segregation ATPase